MRLWIAPFLPAFVTALVILHFLMVMGEGGEIFFKRFEGWRSPVLIQSLGNSLLAFRSYFVLSERQVLVLSALSVVLSCLMMLHHHHLSRRQKRGNSVLVGLSGITDEATRLVISRVEPQVAEAFVLKALQVLTLALTFPEPLPKRNGRVLVATVLENRKGQDALQLIAQWPPKTYQSAGGLTVTASAAGRVLDINSDGPPPNGLVLIPWTYFPHGVILSLNAEDRDALRWHRTRSLVEHAFVPKEVDGERSPASLICIRVPVPASSNRRFVLCLDANRRNCFEEVDYQAANLIAGMLGIVLSELTDDD